MFQTYTQAYTGQKVWMAGKTVIPLSTEHPLVHRDLLCRGALQEPLLHYITLFVPKQILNYQGWPLGKTKRCEPVSVRRCRP